MAKLTLELELDEDQLNGVILSQEANLFDKISVEDYLKVRLFETINSYTEQFVIQPEEKLIVEQFRLNRIKK